MFIVFVNKTIGLLIFLPQLGLTAGTHRYSEYRKIMRFLVYLYYKQPFYRTSAFGQNHANCIQILTVYVLLGNH